MQSPQNTSVLLPGCGMQLSGTGHEKSILKSHQQVGYSCHACANREIQEQQPLFLPSHVVFYSIYQVLPIFASNKANVEPSQGLLCP